MSFEEFTGQSKRAKLIEKKIIQFLHNHRLRVMYGSRVDDKDFAFNFSKSLDRFLLKHEKPTQ